MKIYIASSWRNQHGVEMLTTLLRKNGHEVASWVENNFGEKHNHVTKEMSEEEWLNSPASDQSFEFDTKGATECDVFIFYSPAGMDASAELGAAWSRGIKCFGLDAKGCGLGLMQKMVSKWFDRYHDLLDAVELYYDEKLNSLMQSLREPAKQKPA